MLFCLMSTFCVYFLREILIVLSAYITLNKNYKRDLMSSSTVQKSGTYQIKTASENTLFPQLCYYRAL